MYIKFVGIKFDDGATYELDLRDKSIKAAMFDKWKYTNRWCQPSHNEKLKTNIFSFIYFTAVIPGFYSHYIFVSCLEVSQVLRSSLPVAAFLFDFLSVRTTKKNDKRNLQFCVTWKE